MARFDRSIQLGLVHLFSSTKSVFIHLPASTLPLFRPAIARSQHLTSSRFPQRQGMGFHPLRDGFAAPPGRAYPDTIQVWTSRLSTGVDVLRPSALVLQ